MLIALACSIHILVEIETMVLPSFLFQLLVAALNGYFAGDNLGKYHAWYFDREERRDSREREIDRREIEWRDRARDEKKY
jgi:hypothetical protein